MAGALASLKAARSSAANAAAMASAVLRNPVSASFWESVNAATGTGTAAGSTGVIKERFISA